MILPHNFTQIINQFEDSLTNKIVDQIIDKLSLLAINQKEENLLTDIQICENLQIPTSHFYKLKKKSKKATIILHVGGKWKSYNVECGSSIVVELEVPVNE